MLIHFRKIKVALLSILPTVFICSLVHVNALSQCTSAADLYQQVEKLAGLDSDEIKLQRALELQQKFEDCRFEKDSVYVRILDRIGLFFYFTGDIDNAITWGYKATAAYRMAKNKSYFIAARAYLNLGLYLNEVHQSMQTLAMYDTVGQLCSKADVRTNVVWITALRSSVYLLYNFGEYKQCVDKTTLAIQLLGAENDSISTAKMHAMRGLASIHLGYASNAGKDASIALSIIERVGGYSNNIEAYLNAMIVKAQIAVRLNQYTTSDSIFTTTIQNCRKLPAGNNDIYNFYMEYGNYLSDHKKNFAAAIKWYNQCVELNNPENKATAYLNISQNYWRLKQYNAAERYFYLTRSAQHPSEDIRDFSTVVSAAKWNLIGNKEQLTVTINNNLELLLTRFKSSGSPKYLTAAKSLARTGDSVLALLRHEQVEEVSKLYWREQTREFYRYALETAYLLKDNELAFYFMEKGRAVILNDQIRTLQAINLLPVDKAAQEQQFRIEIIKKEKALTKQELPDEQYDAIERSLLEAKENFRLFTRSLEKGYPGYYKAKYADEVPSLKDLQHYLKTKQQSFVHYFMTDTVAYIMVITASGTSLKKLSIPDYDKEKIIEFLQYCSQPSKLNANYAHYLQLCRHINHQYFEQLNLSKGRIIVCPDNFLIPFEAVATNTKGDHFLVEDYAFSYVYSARNLLMKFPIKPSNGNYLGMAPVSFTAFQYLPTLHHSANAADKSAVFFSSTKLITGEDASKRSFLNNLGRYEVVNVFSHAVADSNDTEPAIYMRDSAIYLSELQLLNDISAQLVLLSACQTSVGRNAAGEGIYSLARGLAAVGIPAVAATLWEADEDAIYALSEKFNEGISKGLPKDIALQQAKLWYLKEFGEEKALPSYWANMILIGDTVPVQFSEHHNYLTWVVVVIGIVVLVASTVLIRKKLSKQ